MKQLLIINGDLEKTDATNHLIEAYRKGAESAGAIVKEVAIVDLIFNFNKQFNNRVNELEPDLKRALDMITWSNHVVLFCPVYLSSIPARIKGFFDRLFMPDQVFLSRSQNISNNFSGRSARIISILDKETFEYWKQDKKVTYLSIKRTVFENCRFHPVHTNTMGQLYALDNDYSKKWLRKLESFGAKIM
ncbi:probable oxidoreductase; possible NAD(P)H dehydrogenase, quinone family protein [Pedobacter sp. BAL39]|uniref:NAD(P)H-dependent oxidoreductase n=1 Tax=Pedobacter sp. BAL39 TaxID=391596 RepID=UPI000155AB36|nr:NAD(P)H-dependent oxidoreductase [Pedobacter sp. BAL39]EDM34697.1 probable oxidoreductase; possible NAD(P)H dehydrogenase, quinone family protein [Pedobacter sp. BAL39]